jgi:hypothetical protein
MTADPASMSLKERAEAQLIAELVQDKLLRALFPRKQNEDGKTKLPRLAVVAIVGKEISPQSGLFNMSVAVEVYFKYPADNAADLDRIIRKIHDRLAVAQASGNYGVILDGEQPTQFVADTIRKRVYAARILAG